MTTVRVTWLVTMGTLVAGCTVTADGDGDGTLEGCTGDYVGTYDGSDAGVAAAVLHADGVLEVLFTSDAGYVEGAERFVDEDGDVSGEEGLSSITGTFDFDTCTASGVWYISDNPQGTWEIARDDG